MKYKHLNNKGYLINYVLSAKELLFIISNAYLIKLIVCYLITNKPLLLLFSQVIRSINFNEACCCHA